MNELRDDKKFTLYVGSTNEHIMEKAKEADPDAYLITIDNVNNEHRGVAYTSLGDLEDRELLPTLLDRTDHIIYDPPVEWTADAKEHSEQWWTELYISRATLYKDVEIKSPDTFPKDRYWTSIKKDEADIMLELKDYRKTDDRQLWFVGCSFTYGLGLEDLDQRYGNILTHRFDLPSSFLAWPATNIPWAADQILRSDIRKDDIVIWGLTQWTRMTHYNREKNQLEFIHAGYYNWFPAMMDTIPPDMLDHPSRIYESIRSIYAVINFCKKVGAKLLLAGMFNGPEVGEYLLENHDDYVYFKTSIGGEAYPDFAPNDLHPGPITHQMYADGIEQKIRELGYL